MAQFRDSWGRFLAWARPSFPDVGTASLGAAAIFLVRVFPSSNPEELDLWMMLPVAFFGLVGVAMRRVGKP